MTIHRNEILPFLLDDPFDGYQEEYDKGLFQFQSNELELNCHRSLFDVLDYDDRVILSKNGIEIRGIVTGKKPSLLNHTASIRIQDGNILVKKEIQRHRYAESTYLRPLSQWPGFIEHLRAINTNNAIFQALDVSFGTCPITDESRIHTLLSREVNKFYSLNPRFYRYGDRLFLRFDFRGNLVIQYEMTSSNVEKYWVDKFPSWYTKEDINEKEKESSPWIRYYNRSLIISLIPSAYNIHSTYEFYDVENAKYIRVDQCATSDGKTKKIFIHAISDYQKIEIDRVYLHSGKQQFLNIIADMCFLTNSYFFVKNFDTLVVRPHNTGYNSIDISKYHNLIINCSQEIEEYEHEDYSLKSVAENGDIDNAFGISQSYIDSINEYYRGANQRVSKIKIEALRKGQNNPFNYIRINDEILDNGKSLGIVRDLNPSKDGKTVEFTLHRYISEEYVNDWWSL